MTDKICSGVDFDDADYGFKEEDKSKTKVRLGSYNFSVFKLKPSQLT